MRAILALVGMTIGCASPGVARGVVATTLDPPEVRRSFLEGTLRVLDEHPEYVDELFAMTLRRHPQTLDRFLEDAARAHRNPAVAARTARILVSEPEGLRRVLVATLEAARRDPRAREAISRAIDERRLLALSIVADRPSAVRGSLETMVAIVQRRPAARRAFLAAVRGQSDVLARLITSDPETLEAMAAALVAYAKEVLVAALAR